MGDLALVVLITVAIAIGFFLGRRSGSRSLSQLYPIALNKSYFQGLNYLLNEQPDKAVEEFVNSLDVNADTMETHLALGKLMRKQGQVDRAIRIHQNLLARPQLDAQHQHQAHLELARDFMTAGLLDRAEMLLKEVIGESPALRGIAQRYLLDIFQDEREWLEAIKIAESLSQSKYFKSNPEKRREMIRMIAHFYCELAGEAIEKNDPLQARKYLDKAYSTDKNCVRASILQGAQENAAGRYKQAIKVLSRVALQNPAHITECLPELLNAHMAADEKDGFEQFVNYVQSHIASYPSTTAMLFLVDQLLARGATEPSRGQQARELLSNYLLDYPSLTGLSKLIEMQLPGLSQEIAHEVRTLRELVIQLMQRRTLYKCHSCGFSGRQLHWRCPSCKRWDEIERLKGIDAD